jgi:hypothetical protein
LDWAAWPLLRVRRFGVGVGVEVAAEPVELPVEAFDEALEFAGAGEVVAFAGKRTNSEGRRSTGERGTRGQITSIGRNSDERLRRARSKIEARRNEE